MPRLLTRQELYKAVWDEPMAILAPRFGISGVGLAKTCRKANIPVPPRGYWAKKDAGKTVVHAALPRRGIGASDNVLIGAYTHGAPTDEEILSPIPPPPVFDEDIEKIREDVRRRIGTVTAPRSLDRAHPAVARLLQQDAERRRKVAEVKYSESPLFESRHEVRRLRVANGLFVALARQGVKCEISGKNAHTFFATVGAQHVRFTIDPPGARRPECQYGPAKEPTTFVLELTIRDWEKPWKSWRDRESSSLEGQLSEIAVDLIVKGEEQHREHALHVHQWRIERKATREREIERQRQEALRQERERQAAEKKARIDRLLAQAEQLRRAGDIRAYVDTVCARVGLSSDVRAWAEWALQQADQVDPVLNGEWMKSVNG